MYALHGPSRMSPGAHWVDLTIACIEHVLTSRSACWFLVPTRFLWSSRQSTVRGGGREGLYFTTNLELLAPPFAQVLDSSHTLSSALWRWLKPAFFLFQIKSPRTPVVQDLEELGALPEEAAGGDEDREKEILMERIQSIKEEKQVPCALPSPVQAGAPGGNSTAARPSSLQGWGPRCQGRH